MTDESLRRSIRAIGLFYYFGSLLTAFAPVGSFVLLAIGNGMHSFTVRHYLCFVLLLGLAAFYFVLGRSLRQFRPWARTATIVMCCIALGGIPIGTIIGGAFLYVLLKAKHLFSASLSPGPNAPTVYDHNAA